MQKQKLHNPIVAHRGAWLEFDLPENSLASLTKAIEIGVGATEFDVHMTADGVLVVHHDYDFFGKKIEQNSYSDLLTFSLTNGEKLPTVADFLEIGLAQHKTQLIFEIKASELGVNRTLRMVDKVVELFSNKPYFIQVEFILFQWEAALHLKKQLPTYDVAYLKGDKLPEEVKQAGLNGIDYQFSWYKKNEDYIAQAQQLGLSLNTWTVNETNDLDYFLNHRFDMITTNHPQLFLEFYHKKSNL
ncbi:glycerophosphodiester phosphodiesterase [Flavobacterium agricola]|uniref:Glycerophosphodiester phosphodiesterase n=1 Tax=Flavobacterium agricola TaxID=2870839 RepID=A0ABY6LW20_9FLAO|nr:glycerophosphodiester phosphodiesterase family protein [Flavobacterium agricola]UYW00431.1 glycerophosphodiester phosphodiesterase [Flavobacterium agricola]